jgi:hypothetical protein
MARAAAGHALSRRAAGMEGQGTGQASKYASIIPIQLSSPFQATLEVGKSDTSKFTRLLVFYNIKADS